MPTTETSGRTPRILKGTLREDAFQIGDRVRVTGEVDRSVIPGVLLDDGITTPGAGVSGPAKRATKGSRVEKSHQVSNASSESLARAAAP